MMKILFIVILCVGNLKSQIIGNSLNIKDGSVTYLLRTDSTPKNEELEKNVSFFDYGRIIVAENIKPNSTVKENTNYALYYKAGTRFDKRYRVKPDRFWTQSFYSGSVRGSQGMGKVGLVLSGVIALMEQIEIYTTASTLRKINYHQTDAQIALNDVNTALMGGLVPEKFQTKEDLSKIADYILRGSTEGMSKELINIGKAIWEDVSTPTLVYPESGMDNYPSKPIDMNIYNR